MPTHFSTSLCIWLYISALEQQLVQQSSELLVSREQCGAHGPSKETATGIT